MAVDASMPNKIYSAPSPTTSSDQSSTLTKSSSGIADNFQTFLTLLTTQLQNQNPLDPLDTNQFTQQLVQFAGVEQQLKSNSQLEALVKLQTTAQATQALNFVGATAVVDGSTTTLSNSISAWGINVPSASTVSVSITNSAGQTVFTGDYKMAAGDHQSFVWDGRGNDGTKWPDGKYKMTAVGKDGNGKSVAVSTEVQGVVDSADLSASPPLLSIGGQSFTVDQVKKIVLPATTSNSSSNSSSKSS